ncbi:hypothetical protein IAQ61_004730 [Plenodomus lingam]|uniref:uncharacterized protein n=1 Tax=Leptosphaeria maculans TaxID=5022 RepID=UPI003323F0B0|nr:hypothetical protein IAQ61_004730 [Plenodomus lingam]
MAWQVVTTGGGPAAVVDFGYGNEWVRPNLYSTPNVSTRPNQQPPAIGATFQPQSGLDSIVPCPVCNPMAADLQP